jgi:hypothetical protein
MPATDASDSSRTCNCSRSLNRIAGVAHSPPIAAKSRQDSVPSARRIYRWKGARASEWRTGDTNGDGCIDDADLLAVLFAFGGAGTGNTRHEDIAKDGIVDDADLLQVLFAFGQGCN